MKKIVENSFLLFSCDNMPFPMTVNTFGHQKYSPSSSWGPGVQRYYAIHFVRSGGGTYTVGNQTFRVEPNSVFVIYPNVPVQYKADVDDPWEYYWLGVSGEKVDEYLASCGISLKSPCIPLKYPHSNVIFDYLDKINNFDKDIKNDNGKLYMMGMAHLTLYELAYSVIDIKNGAEARNNAASNKKRYVENAVQYIIMNYNKPISTDIMAQQLNLNRNYLTRIFKEITGKTPHQFLMDYKINSAIKLLMSTTYTVEMIANSVGFDNQFYFARVFKQYTGLPPALYKKQNKTN